MGKMKIGIYCYFIADILTKKFYKCLLSGPLPNIILFVQISIWLVVVANKRLNLRKKIFKNQLGMKIKRYRNFHSIRFYKIALIAVAYAL